jgi:histidine triad (HIT) family protein
MGERLYEDESAVAFADINPQAPVHILVIPKVHIESLTAVEDENLIGHLMLVVKKLAQERGLSGYRVVINTGDDAGQTVRDLIRNVFSALARRGRCRAGEGGRTCPKLRWGKTNPSIVPCAALNVSVKRLVSWLRRAGESITKNQV